MSAIFNEDTQFIDETTGEPIVNGYIYIGTENLDAKLNTTSIYSDRALTNALANPQRTGSDGRSVNKIWVAGKYSMKVETSTNVQKYNALSLGEVNETGISVLTNAQGTNTITAEGSPTITSLTDKQLYIFTAAGAITGAATLQIDSTPALAIKKNHDIALGNGDIEANQIVIVSHNETDNTYELTSHLGPAYVPLAGGTITGSLTVNGALSTGGAFSSLGIDDQASGETVEIQDGYIRFRNASQVDIGLAGNAADLGVGGLANTDLAFRSVGNIGFTTNGGANDAVVIDTTGKTVLTNNTGVASADSVLHVHKASAGTISSHADAVATLENSGNTALQFLAGLTGTWGLHGGDSSSNSLGSILYNNSSDVWTINGGGTNRFHIGATGGWYAEGVTGGEKEIGTANFKSEVYIDNIPVVHEGSTLSNVVNDKAIANGSNDVLTDKGWLYIRVASDNTTVSTVEVSINGTFMVFATTSSTTEVATFLYNDGVTVKVQSTGGAGGLTYSVDKVS